MCQAEYKEQNVGKEYPVFQGAKIAPLLSNVTHATNSNKAPNPQHVALRFFPPMLFFFD